MAVLLKTARCLARRALGSEMRRSNLFVNDCWLPPPPLHSRLQMPAALAVCGTRFSISSGLLYSVSLG